MKSSAIILCLLIQSVAVNLRAAEAFAAHEWGTFTTIAGSDGNPLPWWTPSLEGPSALPEFVQPVPQFSKGAGAWLLRMETPVIYFYAMTPMSVNVRVNYPLGRFTEAFPSSSLVLPGAGDSSPQLLGVTSQPPSYSWTVELLPPTRLNEAAIPPVRTQGAHYRHAREVPGAWIVRGAAPLDPSKGAPKQTEKFIFYRGAGGGQLPLRASMTTDGSLTVSAWSGLTSDAVFIRVRDGVMHWRPAKIEIKQAADGRLQTQHIGAPDASNDASGLADSLRDSLIKAGLSADEAAAMVATWRDAWLAEEGARLLYVLPRSWVDAALPLTMTPAPQKLERVFVARAELFTPGQELALAGVLGGNHSDVDRANKIAGLRLGRFANAALERAVKLNEQDQRDAFARASIIAQRQNLPH